MCTPLTETSLGKELLIAFRSTYPFPIGTYIKKSVIKETVQEMLAKKKVIIDMSLSRDECI